MKKPSQRDQRVYDKCAALLRGSEVFPAIDDHIAIAAREAADQAALSHIIDTYKERIWHSLEPWVTRQLELTIDRGFSGRTDFADSGFAAATRKTADSLNAWLLESIKEFARTAGDPLAENGSFDPAIGFEPPTAERATPEGHLARAGASRKPKGGHRGDE